jgi:hypothetical protein
MEGLFYGRIDYYFLFQLLQHEEYSSALSYLVHKRVHNQLNVIKKEYSIEVSNERITIVIVLFSGFEKFEYEAIKNNHNLHLITFSEIAPKMIEFENIGLKYYSQLDWLFRVLQLSKDDAILRLNLLKNLNL